ncbi:NAD-dependent epimerase/dehydratase family protein [Akkermansiaceae bacterium]|nr:NAD-dependent epimerase/dehydratase family protein [Akkermansiaceae bacterium]
MRIFVTGGTGFIGAHFIKSALSEGHEVVALRRLGSSPRIDLEQSPEWIEGDLEGFPRSSLSGCDALVHLAAYGVNPQESNDWHACFHWNLAKSFELWLDGVRAGIQRLVICGSCFEYGVSGEHVEFISTDTPLRPQTAYASSKAAATMMAIGLAASHDLKVVVNRPFHVFGDGEAEYRFWPSLRRAAIAGDDFPMTNGAQVRDFVPVELVVKELLKSLCSEVETGRAVIKNIGTGHPKTLAEFARSEWDKFGGAGQLILGALQQRENEVMRFVPLI